MKSSSSPHRAAAVPSDAPYHSLDRTTDEIRLVKIISTPSDSSIRCQVVSYPLDQTPEYLALSYRWGNEDPDCGIELDGQNVNVRKNLLRFFTHIPSRFRSAHLWIDALCINQADQQERTHQVGMMARIYSHATSVLVWLGPAYEGSDVAMKAIGRNHDHWNMQNLAKIWKSREAYALRLLCSRAYWTRLWVVQELVLARQTFLLCGHQHAPWESFEHLLSAARAHPPTIRKEHRTEYESCVSSPARSMVEQLDGRHEDRTLVRQATAFAHLECSNPRDKIYAVLGITRRSQGVVLPDYTVGMTTVLNRVLKQDFALFPPKSFGEVYERACQLPTALGWPKEMIFDLEKCDDSPEVPDEESMQTLSLVHSSGVPLWWHLFYKYDVVTQLWGREHDALNQLYSLLKTAVETRNEAACRSILQIEGVRYEVLLRLDPSSIDVLYEMERPGSEFILQVLLENDCIPIRKAIERESQMERDAFFNKLDDDNELGNDSELDNESQMAFYNKSIARGGGVIKGLLERYQALGHPLDGNLIYRVVDSESPGIVMTFLDALDRISDGNQVMRYYQQLFDDLVANCLVWRFPLCHTEVLKALLARIEHRALAMEFTEVLYVAVEVSSIPTISILLDFIDKTLTPQEAGLLHERAMSGAQKYGNESTLNFLRERLGQREAEKSSLSKNGIS